MEKVLFLFMLFSVVGWLWETPWVSIRQKKYINRGFLHGPYIPIYGCAIVTVVLTMSVFESIESSSFLLVLVQMVYIGLVTAIWEFVTSWGLEKIFHTRWWDYSDHKFNIQGRISLYVTVFFALGGYVLWRFVLPPFEWLYSETPSNIMIIILLAFYTVFTIDSVFTLRDLFRLKNVLATIERISNELSEKLDDTYGDLKQLYYEKRGKLDDTILDIRSSLQDRFDQLPLEGITSRVKEELNRVQTLITSSRNITRFYRKYPHSSSRQLFTIKKWLESLQMKIKK